MEANEEQSPRLGCKVSDLAVGDEFSCDEGHSWVVVRTEPRYISEEPECRTLRFMAAPWDSTSLSAWEEIKMEDTDHVLLEREWSSNK